MKPYVIRTPEPHRENKDPEVGKQNECRICGVKHYLDDWSVFNHQTVEEWSKTLAVKTCYGCYEPVTAHNSKICVNGTLCKLCGQRHPTGIHKYIPKKKSDSKSKTKGDATENTISADKTWFLRGYQVPP